jgi:hypothetical protein
MVDINYLKDYAYHSAMTNGVPPQLFSDLINSESGWNVNAYNSTSGAYGLAQALRTTAADPGYGVSPFDRTDPLASLDFGAQYLKAMYDKFGDWTSAVTAYVRGPGNVDSSGGSPYSGTLNPLQQQVLSDLAGHTDVSTTIPEVVVTAKRDTGVYTSWISSWIQTVGFVFLAILVLGIGLWALIKK